MIALPLSSREGFTKNNIIKAIVIGTQYVTPTINNILLLKIPFIISIIFLPP